MAKKAKKRVVAKGLTRKQRSRLERERRIERVLLWSVVAVAVVVVGVLGVGLYMENVVKPRRPVAMVGDVPITAGEHEARMRYLEIEIQGRIEQIQREYTVPDPSDPNAEFVQQYVQSTMNQLQSQLLTVDQDALEQLIGYELVQQEAAQRDISVPAEELQREIELYFGYDRDPQAVEPTLASSLAVTETLAPDSAEEPLPTATPMTEESFNQLYAQAKEFWRELGISEYLFRSWFEAELLTERLREEMADEVPSEVEQVDVRYLQLSSQEQAQEYAARLDDGEEFAVLQEELSADPESGGYGIELGWRPQAALAESLGPEVAELAFDLEIGTWSNPVPDASGMQFVVIQVLGREVRELDEYLYQQNVDEAFQAWLEAQQSRVVRLDAPAEDAATPTGG